jgi:hypothetical protein
MPLDPRSWRAVLVECGWLDRASVLVLAPCVCLQAMRPPKVSLS